MHRSCEPGTARVARWRAPLAALVPGRVQPCAPSDGRADGGVLHPRGGDGRRRDRCGALAERRARRAVPRRGARRRGGAVHPAWRPSSWRGCRCSSTSAPSSCCSCSGSCSRVRRWGPGREPRQHPAHRRRRGLALRVRRDHRAARRRVRRQGDRAQGQARRAAATPNTIGSSIFRDYLVPFEVVSMLLLAALVGAVVIARRD